MTALKLVSTVCSAWWRRFTLRLSSNFWGCNVHTRYPERLGINSLRLGGSNLHSYCCVSVPPSVHLCSQNQQACRGCWHKMFLSAQRDWSTYILWTLWICPEFFLLLVTPFPLHPFSFSTLFLLRWICISCGVSVPPSGSRYRLKWSGRCFDGSRRNNMFLVH